MLQIFSAFRDLDFYRLAAVYGCEGDYERRNDLYDYLNDDFFRVKGAFYAAWVEKGEYVSALRAEPYSNGYLIEALQTKDAQRNKGYAQKLLMGVLESGSIPSELPVYAHIHKKNGASIAVHRACGFQKYLDHAVFIDGSVYRHSCTVKWIKKTH